jgi:hypothetical protein
VEAGGLVHFDLPIIFRCAVELAEAMAALTEPEWGALPANCEGPESPHFERQMEASRRLGRIEEETQRLKRSLGATGPLEFRGGETEGGPRWESYDKRFNGTGHDRVVRLALLKVATAAIDLSGFATWREWRWHMRETGLRLLTWGLAQLWEGMSGEERSRVRDCLRRTHKAIAWPGDPATDPTAYDGPEEIPVPDQYRIMPNYVSCYRGYLNDIQMAENRRVEQRQEKILRQATLAQFIDAAEGAAQALQTVMKRDFDSAAEWGELYTKAFRLLACLRRAHEIQPREAWPLDALEQRKVLADAAGILLTFVGGTPEAKATCKSEDVNKAFEDFAQAILLLRVIIDPKLDAEAFAAPSTPAAKLPQAGPTATVLEQTADFKITQIGDLWEIKYGTECGMYRNQCVGWLAFILSHPGRRLSVADLVGDPEKNLQADSQLGRERATNAEGVQKIKRRIEEIDEIAETTGGSENLESEKVELMRQLQEASKNLPSAGAKAFHNIASQIRLLIKKKLNSHMPKMAAHLRASLKLDSPHFFYSPTDSISWKT